MQGASLYKICEQTEKKKFNFHSINCLKHLNARSIEKQFIVKQFNLYKKVEVPINFTYEEFIQMKFVHPIEAYSNTCKHVNMQ